MTTTKNILLCALPVLTVAPLSAEIITVRGSAAVEVVELLGTSETTIGQEERVSDAFPNTSTLPLQVVAQLSNLVDNEEAAAVAAAQVADPTILNQPNPEEFAVQLALSAISDSIRYQGKARLQEIREIVFSPAEVGGGAVIGEAVELTGRLFLDGALSITGIAADQDLTGCRLTLSVTVEQRNSGAASGATVFSGEVELLGRENGNISTTVSGDFPQSRLIITDLSDISDDFEAFTVLIIPNIQLDYAYTAVVGQEFELVATVEIDAENAPDETGVVAVLGTPVDAIAQVLDVVQGAAGSQKTLTLLENERADPTGELAFPAQSVNPPLLGLCGLLGFEMMLGAVALLTWKVSGLRRIRRSA